MGRILLSVGNNLELFMASEKKKMSLDKLTIRHNLVGWLLGLNGLLRQYFSLYRAVSQREGERREKTEESKNSEQPPPAPTTSAIGPCPTMIRIAGRPGTGSLLRTSAPPDHLL